MLSFEITSRETHARDSKNNYVCEYSTRNRALHPPSRIDKIHSFKLYSTTTNSFHYTLYTFITILYYIIIIKFYGIKRISTCKFYFLVYPITNVRINGANYIFTHLKSLFLNKGDPRPMFRKLGRGTNPFPSSPRKNWIDRKN